jgi:hypothetical protein
MREIDGVPVYKITIDEEFSEGNELGISAIAFTDSPAIITKGMAFKSQAKPLMFKESQAKPLMFKDDSKMRVAAPVMIPMDIYRSDEDGEYYVEFNEEVIEQIYSKFMQNLSNKDLFNIEHKAENKVPAYVLESMLVDTDAKIQMLKSDYNIDVPKGSVFVVSQITDKDYYNNLVSKDQLGYSIEGFLGLKLNKHNMVKEKYELDGKFYEVVDGKLTPIALEEEKEEEVVMAEETEEKEEVVEEEMAEEVVEEKEEVVEEEMAVDPVVDSNAVLEIVQPLLDAHREEIMGLIAEALNKEEEVEEEVEMAEEVKLSVSQKFSNLLKLNNK